MASSDLICYNPHFKITTFQLQSFKLGSLEPLEDK